MQKAPLIALFIVISLGACFSQSLSDLASQATPSQGTAADCSDPSQAGSVACSAARAQTSGGGQGLNNSSPSLLMPELRSSGGSFTDENIFGPPTLNPSQIGQTKIPLRPETEFEQMVADSAGRVLPLFGQSLFVQPPSTFSPVDRLQVPSDYVIGPGDELQIRIWGQVGADLRVVVDRSGQIYVPQVGQISVAGVHYGDLEERPSHPCGSSRRHGNYFQ